MSRFFKSAAFPILIVVVLAFFAQRLISPDDEPKTPTFAAFLEQVDRGEVKSAELRQKNNTVQVETKEGLKYEVGFAEAYGDQLTEKLLSAETGGRLTEFDVQGRKTNGWLQ